MSHAEAHRSHRTGWLRAAVLGANDGIVSTASLIIGVAAASSSDNSILLAGIAGLVGGAMSMAAGEYVSVSSQADTEQADLAIERKSLKENYHAEKIELAEIYQQRGVEPELAIKVAEQMMAFDALAAHARDDIGISPANEAKPVQAAVFSAIAFTIGACLPLLVVWLCMLYTLSTDALILMVAAFSLVFLTLLGAISAIVGGASVIKGAMRVTFWGALAMALTAAVGHGFGVVV